MTFADFAHIPVVDAHVHFGDSAHTECARSSSEATALPSQTALPSGSTRIWKAFGAWACR